jgi:hypothetical protein
MYKYRFNVYANFSSSFDILKFLHHILKKGLVKQHSEDGYLLPLFYMGGATWLGKGIGR